jgi:ethanolamine transporter
MAAVGALVICIILASAVAGAIAACWDENNGLGKEFLAGFHAIGHIFVPVAGIMASLPLLAELIRRLLVPIFTAVGADPAMAATVFLPADMGGYQLAHALKGTSESWITAMTAGFMAGTTLLFSIPLGLAILEKGDHKYLALGAMAGLLSVPVGVVVASLFMWLTSPAIRDFIGTTAAPDRTLHMSLAQIGRDVLPLACIMAAVALALRLAPDLMIRLFLALGRVFGIFIKIVLAACIVEYLSAATFGVGLFTRLFGSWACEPIIADAQQIKGIVAATGNIGDDKIIRALEVAGYIGITLAGAFPMVYLIRVYLERPVAFLGRKTGLDAVGAAGVLAASANILAMFRLVKDMRPRDKVLVIAFSVCGAFLFGDDLAFTANFQPTLLLQVLTGKIVGGMSGFLIAGLLCVPKARQLAEQDMLEEARQALQEVSALAGRSLTIRPVGFGVTNRTYRVDAGRDAYILRIAGKNTELLGIDRDREIACLETAAAAGVGPEVVAYLPKRNALLTRLVPGKVLDKDGELTPDQLGRIARALRRCHDVPGPANLEAFSVFDTVRSYVALARERRVALPAALAEALAILESVEKDLTARAGRVFTHNDLVASNIVDDGTTVRLIDWEFGGMGDPYFDLGNLAANLCLSDEQEEAVLLAYFGTVRADDVRRLRMMRLASDGREAAWAYLQAGVSRLKSPGFYLNLGARILERLLAAARREGLAA